MRYFWKILALLNLLLSALSSYIFYETYWKWRALFDENGRYFDAIETVVYEDVSIYWLYVAILFGALALFCHLKIKK